MAWTIPIGILRVLAHVAEELDLDPDEVFARAGVAPEDRSSHEHMLPLEGMMAAAEWLIEETQDPAIALMLGRHIRLHELGEVGFMMRSCPTLGAALERVQRFHNLLSLDTDISLRVSPEAAVVSVTRALPDRPARALAIEGVIVGFVALSRELTRQTWPVLSVSFPHPIEDTTAHEAYFGGRILHTPGPAMLALAPETLDLPIVTHDPHLLTFLERRADQALTRRRTFEADTATSRVRAFLEEHLATGAPTATEVARGLGMSRRTMYRQLAAEGSSFGDLLDGLRHELARELLGHPSYPLAQIAFTLGFSEPRAFQRAFKRWTGSTPSAWRVAQTG